MALLHKRALLAASVLSFSVFATTESTPLKPEAGQGSVMTEILEKLSTNHYKKRAVDDNFSEELYTTYLERLDPWKSYFLTSDVESFSHWRTKLDDALNKGDLSYGYQAFNKYREIALAQLAKQIALLESDDYQFNLDDEEYIAANIDDRRWAQTPEERDDWWRKRMEYDLLGIMLRDSEPVAKAREMLLKRYKNDRNRIEELESRDVFSSYAEVIAKLYDPHTSYFSPRSSENFNINMSLSLEGIGAVLERDEDYIRVVRVVPGGPAAKQGDLKAGDKIIGIAENDKSEPVDLIGWRLDDAVELIRGPKNSTAVLQVIPAKASSDVTTVITIIRDKVKLEEQAAKKEVVTVPVGGEDYKVGVISIPTFYLDFDALRNNDPNYKATSKDVARLMGELVNEQKVDGVILDLRHNGGGSLTEATALSDMFINPGPVVQIRNSKDQVDRYQRARRPAAYKGPLIVLIDHLSASASEIFAGAIQDYGRGVIVGNQSFGKGTVQTLVPLSQGQLKLTEHKFYRISGDSTQHRGVIPDITFPSSDDSDDSGESSYDNALEWDTIPSAPYRNYDDLSRNVLVLERLHKARVVGDPEFTFVAESAELDKQFAEEDKRQISLKLKSREESLQERKEKRLAVVNKRRKAKGLEPYADYPTFKDAVVEIDVDTLPLAERDPLLMETSRILVDMIQLERNPRRFAQQPRP